MHSQSKVHHKIVSGWLERLAELPRRLADAVPVPLLPGIAEGILPSPSPAFAGAGSFGDDGLFNSGGPRSRTRTEAIVSGIFEYKEYRLGARPVGELHALHIDDGVSERRALGFRHAAFEALRECGFEDPDAAFDVLADLPRKTLHCLKVPERNHARGAKRPWNELREFLKTALVLGKCSQGLYDPSRPVIWTENRLGQWVELYEIRKAFYEDDDED
ncbi:MAG: hypothetical protein VCA37_08570 [Roseibacillus sp.]